MVILYIIYYILIVVYDQLIVLLKTILLKCDIVIQKVAKISSIK